MVVVLKCPKCGQFCREGAIPFPRCARCHTQLLTCRYCEHFDAAVLDCVSVFRHDDFHVRDPDRYSACPHHVTTLRANWREPVVSMRTWVLSCAIAIIAIAGVMLLARQVIMPSPRAPVLQGRFAAVRRVLLRDPAYVDIQVWNPGPGDVQDVLISLDRSFESHFTLNYVEPQPDYQRHAKKAQRMWFGKLADGGVLEVRVNLTPVKIGRTRLQADVITPGARRPEHLTAAIEIVE